MKALQSASTPQLFKKLRRKEKYGEMLVFRKKLWYTAMCVSFPACPFYKGWD
jgi:hypothetical protein